MTEKTMLQRTATVGTKHSGSGRARSATLPGKQPRTGDSNFSVKPASLPDVPFQFAIKRIVDIASAFFGLLIFAPAFLVIAVLIKLESKGPVFSRHLHTGLHGAPFELLTFRSVRTDVDGFSSARQPIGNDPHLTRLGRFLHRSNLDPLPRLWNVLLGDMSLVGPRPHVPDMLAAGRNYSDLVQGYEYRHLMRPGLTGLVQPRDLHGPADNRWMAIRQILCDLDYVRQFSLLLDTKIVLRIAINALKGRTSL